MATPAEASRRWGTSDRWAILALIAMAIAFPELLTGSTPFLSLLNPLAVLGLVGLYGAGVLAVREFRVRWHAGWPAVLLLGAAYGVLEEGFATRTFFAPASLLGLQGSYGHFGGINWVWAVQLATFHSVFSIAVPILLGGVAFPGTQDRPLLTRRGAWGALAITFVTAGVLAVGLNPSVRPPLGLQLGVLAIGAILVVAGVGLRAFRFPGPRAARPSYRRLFGGGSLWVTTFFALNWIGPVLIPSPAILVGMEILAGVGIAGWTIRQYGPVADPRASVALAAGLLSFLLLFASILEVFGDWGVGIAVGAVGYTLFRLYRRPDLLPGTAGVPPAGAGIAGDPPVS